MSKVFIALIINLVFTLQVVYANECSAIEDYMSIVSKNMSKAKLMYINDDRSFIVYKVKNLTVALGPHNRVTIQDHITKNETVCDITFLQENDPDNRIKVKCTVNKIRLTRTNMCSIISDKKTILTKHFVNIVGYAPGRHRILKYLQ